MLNELFINGTWQKPSEPGTIEVFNPCTEEVLHRVAAGGPADVDKAVHAAKAALPGWKKTGGAVRGRFLKAIAAKPLVEAQREEAPAAGSFKIL